MAIISFITLFDVNQCHVNRLCRFNVLNLCSELWQLSILSSWIIIQMSFFITETQRRADVITIVTMFTLFAINHNCRNQPQLSQKNNCCNCNHNCRNLINHKCRNCNHNCYNFSKFCFFCNVLTWLKGDVSLKVINLRSIFTTWSFFCAVNLPR